jgi:hypothetical protein
LLVVGARRLFMVSNLIHHRSINSLESLHQ